MTRPVHPPNKRPDPRPPGDRTPGSGGTAPRRRGLIDLLTLLVAVLLALDTVPRFTPAQAEDRTPPAGAPSEAQVKAAIIVGLARATEWLGETNRAADRELRIGILGRDTFGEEATSLFRNPSRSGGRKVTFSVVNDDEARSCHALFIPRTERRRAREQIERLKNLPVLTIGESDEFLEQNGMVNLVVKEGAMKFEINLAPVKAANLRIPAKVLGSALRVQGKYEK
jgi:hypothetical protein